MPHIIVKLVPGRTEEQKIKLTDKIVQAVMETVDAGESSISVSFEEVPSEKWEKEVYQPDILGKEKTLYKKPGYRY
jgi:4-oxalocrotonate tautomerase